MMKLRQALPALLLSLIGASLVFTSCKKKIEATNIIILDSVRHYYSALQGQEVEIIYNVANLGDVPLVLTDIQPSCGCISVDKNNNNIIAPQGQILLHFRFSTDKYTGYVQHTIRLFGNILPDGMAVMKFDINIVPPYNASPDYEDIYHEYVKSHIEKGILDADESERGYWTDEFVENDNGYDNKQSHRYERYPWKIKQKADKAAY